MAAMGAQRHDIGFGDYKRRLRGAIRFSALAADLCNTLVRTASVLARLVLCTETDSSEAGTNLSGG